MESSISWGSVFDIYNAICILCHKAQSGTQAACHVMHDIRLFRVTTVCLQIRGMNEPQPSV